MRSVPDGARRGTQQRREHREERRFTRAVGTKQSENHPARRAKGHARDGSPAAEMAGHVLRGNFVEVDASRSDALTASLRSRVGLVELAVNLLELAKDATATLGLGIRVGGPGTPLRFDLRELPKQRVATCDEHLPRFVCARLAADGHPCPERQEADGKANATKRGVRLCTGRPDKFSVNVPPAGRAGPFPSTNRSPLSVRMSLV